MIWIEASIDFVTTHVGEKEREIVLKMKVFEDRPSKKSSSIKEEDAPEEASRSEGAGQQMMLIVKIAFYQKKIVFV